MCGRVNGRLSRAALLLRARQRAFAGARLEKRARARLLHDFDSHRHRRGDRRAGIGGARRLRWWWKKLTDGDSLYKTNIGFLSDKLSNRFVSRVRIRR